MSARHFPTTIRGTQRAAFTLVELLVVIAIIALLISILLPSLMAAREQARMTACLSHMRELGRGALIFAGEHGDRIQLVTDEVGLNEHFNSTLDNVDFDVNGELMSWTASIAKVLGYRYRNNGEWGVLASDLGEALEKQREIKDRIGALVCPSDKVQLGTPYYPRKKAPDNNGLKGLYGESAPLNTSYWGHMSYGINEDIAGAEVQESNGAPACWRPALTQQGWYGCKGEFNYPPAHPCGDRYTGKRLQGRLEKVYEPSTAGLMFESGPDAGGPQEWANLIISAQADGPYLGDFQVRFGTRMPSNRHRGTRLNVLFSDMHGEPVEPVRFEQISANGKVKTVTSVYNPRVRVSPYPVHKIEDD